MPTRRSGPNDGGIDLWLYLMGTEIDFVDSLAGAGFKFQNPSARRTCGCGESFSI